MAVGVQKISRILSYFSLPRKKVLRMAGFRTLYSIVNFVPRNEDFYLKENP
jgi:hypothetical protein